MRQAFARDGFRGFRGFRGFTLIELLVVITIIMVLLSMLMPAMNKALEASQRVICRNNEHQIHMGALAFASDNGGMLPPSNIDNLSHVYLVSANVRHGEIVGSTRSTLWGHLVEKEYLSRREMDNSDSAIFYCPSRDPWDRYGYYGAANRVNKSGSLGWPNWYGTSGPFGAVEISYMSRGNIKFMSQVDAKTKIYATDVFWDDSYRRDGTPQGYHADYGDLGHKGYNNILFYNGAVTEYRDDRELLRNAGFHGAAGVLGLTYLEAEL